MRFVLTSVRNSDKAAPFLRRCLPPRIAPVRARTPSYN